MSYGIEKAVSKHPEKFGQGAIEGVAAPEGSNNAETGGALVPLLTLGIPGSGTTAILLAALILWGFKPGPLFIHDSPNLFWGLVASMYIGNVLLLVLNLPLVAVFAQLLRMPAYAMNPLILGVSIIGVYTSASSMFQLGLLAVFGLLGYAMRKLEFPTAPLVLGLVLGDAMEKALRQSLMMSQGDPSILVRPLPAVLLGFAALLFAVPLFRKFNAARLRVIDREA
jgi:putative tricarboxylic transport membrane protein